MKYISQVLTQSERILFLPTISYIIFLPHLPFVFLYGIGLITMLKPLLSIYTTEIAITNKRLIYKEGLIQRNSFEFQLDKIENIQIHQSLWGRLFRYGDITIIGSGGSRGSIEMVHNPLEFKRELSQSIDQTRP